MNYSLEYSFSIVKINIMSTKETIIVPSTVNNMIPLGHLLSRFPCQEEVGIRYSLFLQCSMRYFTQNLHRWALSNIKSGLTDKLYFDH
jgi:hypothetical protein